MHGCCPRKYELAICTLSGLMPCLTPNWESLAGRNPFFSTFTGQDIAGCGLLSDACTWWTHIKQSNCKFAWRFIVRNSLRRSGMARVNDGLQFCLPPTRLSTGGMNYICLYSPAALCPVYSFSVLLRVEGWVAGYKPRWFTRPQTVTYRNTNQARHRVT